MSEAIADPSFGMEEAEARGASRRMASERITVINTVQSVVGAYLSAAQVEDVAAAVLHALRREP